MNIDIIFLIWFLKAKIMSIKACATLFSIALALLTVCGAQKTCKHLSSGDNTQVLKLKIKNPNQELDR